MEDTLGLPLDAFTKLDVEDDAIFYEPPRLVCHIDDAAITALTGFYRSVLSPKGVLLDLMSSWVSHLPPEIGYAQVIGHGMNATELAANPRLTRWFVIRVIVPAMLSRSCSWSGQDLAEALASRINSGLARYPSRDSHASSHAGSSAGRRARSPAA